MQARFFADSPFAKKPIVLDTRVQSFTALLLAAGLLLHPAAYADAKVSANLTPAVRKGTAADAQFHAMAGEMAAGRQMPATAAEEFLQALDYTADAQLARRATAYALAAKRDDLALLAARKWLAADSSALEAREVLARLSLQNGATAEAGAQCQAIISGEAGGEADGFRHVALLLSQEKDFGPAALALMKSLVANRPQLAGAQRAMALLAFRFEDYALAEKSAREALRLAPAERESTLLLVGALIKKGDIAAAEASFESLVQQQKDNGDLRLGYARLLIEGDHRPQAYEQLGKVLKADPANGDAHFATALLLLDERRADEAAVHLNRLLEIPERQADAAYYLGRIAEQKKQYDAALGWYEKVDSGNQSLDAFLRRAQMLGALDRLPEARELLGGLREQYPPLASRLLATEADLLADHQDYQGALALYASGLKSVPDDADLLYARSLIYEKTNRIDLTEKDLRQIIAKDPNDARALNALGYLITLHTSRYDEAARLIGRARELTPKDPAVLDSWGWVLVKQGKVKEGAEFLQQAYSVFPDAEVAAHLGEALWMLGEKDNARSLWESAAKEDPAHKVLRETMQRLLGNK